MTLAASLQGAAGRVPEGMAGLPAAASVQAALAQPGRPCVLRGLAAHWPAVREWRFDTLAGAAPRLPVQLVAGNRERGATRFVAGTLDAYLRTLAQPPAADHVPLYLKEFDLLGALPQLRQDLRPHELWPRQGIVSSSVWVGPARARTGLHHDWLDNLAVLVTGSKRFYLAPPGSVEAAGAVSAKHDRWALLATEGVDELAARLRGRHTLHCVDLAPGDVLYVPRGWWHEVVNLQASTLLSGFFGSSARVLGLWAWTGARQLLHQAAGRWRRPCTCHAAER
jgi:hypothetical protein